MRSLMARMNETLGRPGGHPPRRSRKSSPGVERAEGRLMLSTASLGTVTVPPPAPPIMANSERVVAEFILNAPNLNLPMTLGIFPRDPTVHVPTYATSFYVAPPSGVPIVGSPLSVAPDSGTPGLYPPRSFVSIIQKP